MFHKLFTRSAFLSVFLFAVPCLALAQHFLQLEPYAPGQDPFALTGDLAPDGPPDARIARRAAGDIVAAWFAEPTTRYRHAVIGDGVEAGALVAQLSTGTERRLRLPENEVFEDVTPRLADLDGDGAVEIITIRSAQRAGAAVSIYGLEGDVLVLKASTPFIGRSNRWLNIAAIAPFRGGEALQIAYVETPHIGGTLRLWSYQNGDLRQLAARFGFSNHAIGAYELRLSAVVDVDGDGIAELLVPNESRRRLRLMAYDDGEWVELAAIEAPSRVEAIVTDADGRIIARFADGGVYLVEIGL